MDVVKTLIPLAAPFTTAVIDTWLKPVLNKLRSAGMVNRELVENGLSSKFEEYVNRTYHRLSYLDSLVFSNERKLLEDLYLPTKIRDHAQRLEIITLNGFPQIFLDRGCRALIIDSAGMGKSTALKYLYLSAVRRNLGIPIFFELRKLSRELTFLEALIDELTPVAGEINPAFVRELVASGHFIFLLDGFDEIPLAEREAVTRDLSNFIMRASTNIFVVTSRPEQALVSFSGFVGYNILPLERTDAFAMIERYGANGDLAKRLIHDLERNELHSIDEFLRNPLLVSLLFKSYEFKPVVPFKKPIFYRQVFDALYETHDLSKGDSFTRAKQTQLDIEDFHRVLRGLGFITAKLGKLSYTRDEINSYIQEALSLTETKDVKSGVFLRDLLTSVPLFVHDGQEYRWAHKSIQEYFSACFICFDTKEFQREIFRRLASDVERHISILDLCYDLDYPSFQREILVPLAESFLSHIGTTYRATYASVSPHAVQTRRILTFARIFVIGPLSQFQLGELSEVVRNEYNCAVPAEYCLSMWESLTEGHQEKLGTALHFTRASTTALVKLLHHKNDLLVVPTTHTLENYIPGRALQVFGQLQTVRVLSDEPSELYNQGDNFVTINDFLSKYSDQHLNVESCQLLVSRAERTNGPSRRNRILEGF